MRRDWLNTRFGLNFVAAGLVLTLLSVVNIMVQDIAFLVTGTWPKLSLLREALYVLYAAVAALFSVVNFFTFLPGLPRFVTVALVISFVSYVVQPFFPVPQHGLTAVCIGRILGFCSLLLLVWSYMSEQKTKRITPSMRTSPDG